MKLYPRFLMLCSISFALTACGGGGGGGGDSLANLLTTGTISTDTASQWNCNGNDGTDPVSFSQFLFSDGTGQVVEPGFPAQSFTWTTLSSNAISVTFPGDASNPEETFSITNISISDVNSSNDKYDGTDSRNGTALSCTRSVVSVGTTDTLAETIINAGIDPDARWLCPRDDGLGAISYYILSDGTGLRYGSDYDDLSPSPPPSMNWTADESNLAIDIAWNGQSGTIGAINFQDNNSTFTAVDSFEAVGITCSRSAAPGAPTPPTLPGPNTSCPCAFNDVNQFLTTAADATTTIVKTDVAGGSVVDISLSQGTFQLTINNVGFNQCTLTSDVSSFTQEDQIISSITSERLSTCESEFNELATLTTTSPPIAAACPAAVVNDFNIVNGHIFFPENPNFEVNSTEVRFPGNIDADFSNACQVSKSFTAGGGQVFRTDGIVAAGGSAGIPGSVAGTFLYAFKRDVSGNFVDGTNYKEIGSIAAPYKLIDTYEEAQACAVELLGCTDF